MRSPSPLRLLAKRFLAALMAFTMVFAQVETAFAALTPLADVPIAAKVAAKPNIVYTLDDSGSMKANFLPDYITSTSSNIPLTNITRSLVAPGTTATATLSAANNALFSVGDFITIAGVSPPEYNGLFAITAKPTGTTFTYTLASVPVGTTTTVDVAAGYTNRLVTISTAYCRSGPFVAGCTQQAFNISPSTTYPITTITRPAASTLATATVSAANNALLTTGDYITIQNATQPEYNGFFQITKINGTQFTYTMSGVPAVSPAGGGSKQFVLVGGTWAAPPLHASDFNRLAYNPAVTYTAPVLYDALNPYGTPLTSLGTDTAGNYGATAAKYNTATVERDPFANFETAAGETPMWTYATKDNLNLRVNVQVYCNSDWPLLVNDPSGGINVRDVGDANGQYSATAGGHCRINGTQYAAVGSAPLVSADYNYPWQKTLAATAEDAKYFYRQMSNKTLWCDATSPNRPRTGVILNCGVGGTPTYAGPPVQQRCVRGGNICNPTIGSRNYLPAGVAPALNCNTDPANLFCAPNVGGSDGNSRGTGALPECAACTCVADTTNPNGSCNSSGAFCNSAFGVWGGNLAQCPDVPNTITGCSVGTPVYQLDSFACNRLVWNPATNSPFVPNITLLTDSNDPNLGRVCRHNNMTYTVGGAAGMFKYSAAAPAYAGEGTGTGLFNQATTSSCPAVGTVVGIPRHYYMLQPIAATGSNIQFCDNFIATAEDPWRGFGTGVCQDKNDLAQFKNVKYGQFVRVDLFATNAMAYAGTGSVYPPNGDGVPRVWLDGTSPTPDNSESINYANWYAYYSTRLNAGKTTSSIAFSYLTTPASEPINYRVGFHNFGDESPPNGADSTGVSIKWVNVDDWSPAQRTAWYAQLFGIAVAFNRTPTMNAMLRVGGLFENGVPSGGVTPIDVTVNPLPATAADPIDRDAANNLISCQNNYHILFTDGVTNQNALPTTAGDFDATVPAFMRNVVEVLPDKVLTNFRPPIVAAGGPWPRPFVQGTPAVANTLSDIAAFYWGRDLRISLQDDVPNQSGAANGDLDWTKDVAWWQHVNFNAISFGAEGTLDAVRQAPTMSALKLGTKNWPNLTQPNNPIYPKGAAKGAVAIDDLWHATTMARGAFVYARTPTEVAYGLASILAGIQNQRKSRAAVAFSGQVLDATTNVVFIPTIEPGWAGDLIKQEIDPVTADVRGAPLWQASDTIKVQIDPASAAAVALGVTEPWMDERFRRVVTLPGPIVAGTATGAVAFLRGNLHADQQLSLAPEPGGSTLKQEKLVSYLRGGNTYTPLAGTPVYAIEGTGIGQFRKRYGALGDISNAEPVIINPPDRPYKDATDPGYVAWKNDPARSGRPSVVVAPANDGMVHVFDAGPMPQPGRLATDPPLGPGGGTELFAFIPKALFRGIAGAAATEDVTALQALAYQDGGVPIYHHHMYVDSSPRAADVDFSGGAGTDWRSIVVGGLGKGGNSYYALDVTDLTSVPDEATAAAKVLWEWSNAEVRYSFGRPVIVKVRDSGYANGRWVVIVTGGYNNVTGLGKVFFLDAANGTLIAGATVTTSVGSGGSPSGLAQIHAFVKDQSNQIAEQIYGGDLEGNFWRIDVSAADSYRSGATAELFAVLHDGTNRQPVTTAPQIEIDVNNGVDRYVFIGTGRLLDQRDLTDPNPPRQQTFYAIRDGTLQTPSVIVAGSPIDVRSGFLQPINPDGTSSIAGGAPNGWYDDLPNIVGDAQRIVVDVQANVNVAQYVGTKVQDDPCIISLPAVLYARDYTTARSLIADLIADPNGNTPKEYQDLGSGAVGNLTVGVRLPDGSFSISALMSGEIPGTTPVKLMNPVTGPGNRLSWRLLGVE